MYIIQTNRFMDEMEDFQSYTYEIEDTWEEFKEYVLHDVKLKKSDRHKLDFIRPNSKFCKVEPTNISDNHHLRVKITRSDEVEYIIEYFLKEYIINCF